MAGYVVDYSGDHAYVDGVNPGTYTPPGGSGESVNCREAALRHSDIQGSALGVSPGDVPFTVWGIAGDAQTNGTLNVESVTYMVIEVPFISPDGSQQKLICRKQVS